VRGLTSVLGDLEPSVHAVLDGRLSSGTSAPLAVGLSGGGDSLALLLMARSWAGTHGRTIIALTVDHGLQAQSADWVRTCAARCEALGIEHRVLAWTGVKPATGLPAAARAARHALLADAARAAGASILLLGHTADDLAESAAMRAEGSTVPDPRLWTPSPAWPEGRDVFLLRPMLSVRRVDLRSWLTERGERWIEDPANEDLNFARARARLALTGAAADPAVQSEATDQRPSTAVWTAWGAARVPRTVCARELAAACLCASGTSRPPRSHRINALIDRLANRGDFSATLAGARVQSMGDQVIICREAGEYRRGASPVLRVLHNRTDVFDGRFEITAHLGDLAVRPLAGHTRRLPEDQQKALKALPAAARPTLPVVTTIAGLWTCPILADSPEVSARSLSAKRFEAFQGSIFREADAQPVATSGEVAGGVLS
jgi:tRNA(Ile)-lysidine synthase